MLTESDRVVLFMRQGCHVCARVRKHLEGRGVPFTVRDVDREELTPRELWEILTRKANRLRVPFTVLNDGEDVVLGHDPLRLDGVFTHGDHGGWQASTVVNGPRVYDDFTSEGIDGDRWERVSGSADVRVGGGVLEADAAGVDAVHLRSRERFATPPGSALTFATTMTGETGDGGRATLAATDVAGGMRFAFGIESGVIHAEHQRLLLPGVTLQDEAYRHRVVLDDVPDPLRPHLYAVRYTHSTGRVEWLVDGVVRYWATSGTPVEGCTLELAVSAAHARWDPWTVVSA